MVLFERTPRHCHGRPDVIGVTASRYLVEIEIKRSLSDFRANAKKYHIENRDAFAIHAARQFWYLVPAKLREPVLKELPEWAGLLTDEQHWLHCVKKAPVNEKSRRVSVREVARLVELQSNQLWATTRDFADHLGRVREDYGLDYQI